MSDMSVSTMGIGLNGRSVKRFLFTLLPEWADILFVEEAVALRGGMKFTVYVEILSSERNKEELSGFDSIEFVGISLGKYQDRCGIISGIIFAGR